jgi:hypothetical protein
LLTVCPQDYRTPGTGLYAALSKYDLPQPECLFDIECARILRAVCRVLNLSPLAGTSRRTPNRFAIFSARTASASSKCLVTFDARCAPFFNQRLCAAGCVPTNRGAPLHQGALSSIVAPGALLSLCYAGPVRPWCAATALHTSLCPPPLLCPS